MKMTLNYHCFGNGKIKPIFISQNLKMKNEIC